MNNDNNINDTAGKNPAPSFMGVDSSEGVDDDEDQ